MANLPALHFYAKEGALDRVRSFLSGRPLKDRDFQLTMADEKGDLPCHHAARRGHVDILMELFPNTDHAMLLNRQKRSILHLAAAHGHVEAVQWILSATNPNVDLQDEEENTSLHLAVLLGHTNVVHILVTAGASPCVLNKDEMMPVSYCCHPDMFHATVATWTCAQVPYSQQACVDTYGRMILHYAAQYAADADVIAGLISASKGASQLKKKDKCGDTFLHVAAKAGNMSVLKALKKLGPFRVDIASLMSGENLQNSSGLLALLHDHRNFFDELVTMGTVEITLDCIIKALVMELIGRKEIEKELVLFASTLPTYLALFANKHCVFDFMLETTSLTISQWDGEYNRTCLHWAVIHNRRDILEKLCQRDHLRPGIEDGDGKTAMQHAFDKKDYDALEILRSKPAFKDHEEKLYRDRDVYMQALNAILVGAALIVSVTFVGWLQLPTPTVNKTLGLKAFWASNGLSFYTAVATMCVTIAGLIPTPTWYIGDIVNQLRLAIVLDASLLALSLAAVMWAFAAAGFAALHQAHIFEYQKIMQVTTVAGGILCLLTWLGFVLQLYKCAPPLKVVLLTLIRFVRLSPSMFRQRLLKNTLANVGDSTRSCFPNRSHTQIRQDMHVQLVCYRSEELAPVMGGVLPSKQTMERRLKELNISNKDSIIEDIESKKEYFKHRKAVEGKTSNTVREFRNL